MVLTQESATALTVSLPLLTSYPITRFLRYIHRPETRLLYSRRGARTQRTTETSLCSNIHDTVCTQSSELSVYSLLSLMLLSSWLLPAVYQIHSETFSLISEQITRPPIRRVRCGALLLPLHSSPRGYSHLAKVYSSYYSLSQPPLRRTLHQARRDVSDRTPAVSVYSHREAHPSATPPD